MISATLWWRSAIVWMAFMLLETCAGVTRELFIAPVIGGLRARQLGVLVGSMLILVVAWLLARWLNARTRREQLLVGGFWVVLTLVFEMTLGRAMGSSWSRILADYNPARGGLMLLGLAFMFCTPMLIKARTR